MYPNMTEELLDPRPEDVPALKKELSEGVEKYRADMDKDFLKEKLEELKAADTDIVEKAIAAFSAGATISEVRTARAAKADSIEVRKIYAHRWTERLKTPL